MTYCRFVISIVGMATVSSIAPPLQALDNENACADVGLQNETTIIHGGAYPSTVLSFLAAHVK